MVMNTGLKVYKVSCRECDWSKHVTVGGRFGPLGPLGGTNSGFPRKTSKLSRLLEKLLYGSSLPSRCPKCGGKVKSYELPIMQ